LRNTFCARPQGQKAEVTLNDGTVYSGIVHGVDPVLGCLRLDYASCKVRKPWQRALAPAHPLPARSQLRPSALH
jgi:hypothetical protein